MHFNVLGSRRLAGVAFAAATIAGLGLCTAGPAAAVTDDSVVFVSSYPGKSVRYLAGDHANDVTVTINTGDEGTIVFTDPNAVNLSTSSPCTLTNSTTVTCPKYSGPADTDKVFFVSVIGNGGDDTMTSEGFGMVKGSTFRPISLTMSGFAGNDTITANGGMSSLIGGDGNDTLTSGPGHTGDPQFKDRVLGDNGDDVIDTWSNSSDSDGIYCDTQYAQIYLNVLDRDSSDIEYSYFAWPTSIPSCQDDDVTIH